MTGTRSWILGAGMLAVAVGAGFAVFAWEPPLAPVEVDAGGFPEDLVQRGEQLAAVGNCAVCHTTDGGTPYAGGYSVETPFGVIYGTNITPDRETGIGTWSEAAFVRAMRDGVNREGQHLYPAFPYHFFVRIKDEDLRAIYAYLMTLPPAPAEPVENDLPFPFGFPPAPGHVDAATERQCIVDDDNLLVMGRTGWMSAVQLEVDALVRHPVKDHQRRCASAKGIDGTEVPAKDVHLKFRPVLDHPRQELAQLVRNLRIISRPVQCNTRVEVLTNQDDAVAGLLNRRPDGREIVCRVYDNGHLVGACHFPACRARLKYSCCRHVSHVQLLQARATGIERSSSNIWARAAKVAVIRALL